MFVGREQELASLEEFYAKDGIGMTVIYGRRRIGKSRRPENSFSDDWKSIFETRRNFIRYVRYNGGF